MGFFVKQALNFQLVNWKSTHKSFESLFIKVSQPKLRNLLLGVIYRPPGQPLQMFNEEFDRLLAEITLTKQEIIILGDFNIDLLKASQHPYTNLFLDTISSYNLLPAIERPTRITDSSHTLIDNITNLWPRMVNSSITVKDIPDHLPIVIWIEDGPGCLDRHK